MAYLTPRRRQELGPYVQKTARVLTCASQARNFYEGGPRR